MLSQQRIRLGFVFEKNLFFFLFHDLQKTTSFDILPICLSTDHQLHRHTKFLCYFFRNDPHQFVNFDINLAIDGYPLAYLIAGQIFTKQSNFQEFPLTSQFSSYHPFPYKSFFIFSAIVFYRHLHVKWVGINL